MQPLTALESCGNVLSEFKDALLTKGLLAKVSAYAERISIMEVCGTHTVAFFRSGIRSSLPKNFNLVSGPGCPVCVTSQETIEKAIRLSERPDTALFCFGDMLKVPGTKISLEEARAIKGAQVRLMYSPLEALAFAKEHKDTTVVLFGVGFETTVGIFASVLLRAREEGVANLFLLSSFKVIPPALAALLSDTEVSIDGLLLPGHVSAIIGESVYKFIPEEFSIPAVICGFEPLDMLQGIDMLINMKENKEPKLLNQYSRFVSGSGNLKAREAIYSVFTESDAVWRGLGQIKGTGLSLRKEFRWFDAESLMDFGEIEQLEPKGCRCGEVIKGKAKPTECPLYKKGCSPSTPIGPCMVSSEGTCAAYYKYG